MIFEAKKSNVFMIDADKIRDIAMICGLYKSFPRYQDHTYEDVLQHILPSIILGQYKVHYENNLPIAFTNWAFLNEETEQKFMKTADLDPQDYNSGTIAWHIDTICCGNIKKVMKWSKEYFTKLLGYNKPVKWLRMSDNETIKRMAIRYTKGHYA